MRELVKNVWHHILHVFGWNTGEVVTWWTKGQPPRLMTGFKCDGCHKVFHIAPCHTNTDWHKTRK